MKTKIGWIGLGKMGIPMSGHLLDAGYPLYVYSRTENQGLSLIEKGAIAESSPKQLAENVGVLFLMLPDDASIREVFTGIDGILSAELRGKTIINCSTVSPGVNREMARLCEQKGGRFLDAPVSGSVRQAQERSLVFMAGGDALLHEAAKPLFAIMGSASVHMGAVGTGNAAKLAVNLLLAIQAQGLAETLNFAQAQGLDQEKVLSVINGSVLGSRLIRHKGELVLSGNYAAAFGLGQLSKDLRLAKSEGLDSPLADAAFSSFASAEAEFGSRDIIAIKQYLEGSTA